jgi:hypothetical protein
VQVTAAQWMLEYYPQGKTSTESKYNIPGRVGWVIGEITAPLTLLYIYFTLPKELGSDAWELPWGNWTMAGCYVSAGEGPQRTDLTKYSSFIMRTALSLHQCFSTRACRP